MRCASRSHPLPHTPAPYLFRNASLFYPSLSRPLLSGGHATPPSSLAALRSLLRRSLCGVSNCNKCLAPAKNKLIHLGGLGKGMVREDTLMEVEKVCACHVTLHDLPPHPTASRLINISFFPALLQLQLFILCVEAGRRGGKGTTCTSQHDLRWSLFSSHSSLGRWISASPLYR